MSKSEKKDFLGHLPNFKAVLVALQPQVFICFCVIYEMILPVLKIPKMCLSLLRNFCHQKSLEYSHCYKMSHSAHIVVTVLFVHIEGIPVREQVICAHVSLSDL